MEKEEDNGVTSRMIQINPEITAQFAKDLEMIQQLREEEKRLEIVTSQVTAKIDQVLRDEQPQN